MQDLENGPLPKTLHTQTLELIAKVLLRNPESLAFTFTNANKTLSVHFQDNSINITELLQKANLNHIQLDEADSELYLEIFNEDPNTTTYKDLTAAEKIVLRGFTSTSYFINNLLYGNYKYILECGYLNNQKVQDILLQTLFVASGLNKIMPETLSFKTYRGEGSTLDPEIEKRKVYVTDQEYYQERAFKSTTSSYEVAKRFSRNKVLIEFEHAYGKDISGISYFKNEKEYLLNAEKIQWLSHKQEKELNIFKARVVNPLDPIRDAVTDREIDQFLKLKEYAEYLDIEFDFLTDFNRAQLPPQPSWLDDLLSPINTCTALWDSTKKFVYDTFAQEYDTYSEEEDLSFSIF
ncbi:MAG TPA: hypothetical protein VFP93_02970 [Gammaproteobacteria bacterium]|nr:hypothetical protein [Gammaproteobacteria bacterium]